VYPAVAGDLVLMGGQSGRGLHALHRLTGALQWMKPLGGLYARQPAVDDSSAYVLRDSLWRIDLATGATRWVKPYAAAMSPALDASSVYIANRSSIAAVDKATGEIRWSVPHAMPSYSSIAVAGNVLYASSADTISAYAKATGVVLWTHSLRGKVMARSAASCFGVTDSVLCYSYEDDTTTHTGGVAALDIRSGAPLWTHPYTVAAGGPLAIVDGVVYTTEWKKDMLHAIRVRDGQTVFIDSTYAFEYQPVFGDGMLYVAAYSRIVPFASAGTGAAEPPAPRMPITIDASPNPFIAGLTLRIEAAPGDMRVTVVDAIGRTVAVLFHGPSTGALQLRWDGRDPGGAAMPSGVYRVVAERRDGARQKPVLLLR
jgi:outer membrane protein assembly factor BamB